MQLSNTNGIKQRFKEPFDIWIANAILRFPILFPSEFAGSIFMGRRIVMEAQHDRSNDPRICMFTFIFHCHREKSQQWIKNGNINEQQHNSAISIWNESVDDIKA